jgi:conjugal transfer pilus assembly protein TraB
LALDFAYVLPNRRRLDLAGCFAIAKAQGDLSTERLQMQATKLSCVGRDGRMFEREVSGFVADDRDNSFAVSGEVVSKQNRVAVMAFLASVVEGVGKAIQGAQTTQQVSPLGGTSTVLTGDQGKYLAAGGASDAGAMVAQWYLKEAQGLLPTINVNSGRDVWLVMQESVSLPSSYFKRVETGGETRDSYSYVTRLLE